MVILITIVGNKNTPCKVYIQQMKTDMPAWRIAVADVAVFCYRPFL